MKHTLLLGSQSASRKMLLEEARIPFITVSQSADESKCDWTLPLPEVVKNIALFKMTHLQLPSGNAAGQMCFVLTADTLSQDHDGQLNGKPVDREDAKKKIKKAQKGSYLCTAFCVDRKIWRDNAWQVDERIVQVVGAAYKFVVPDNLIDHYLDNSVGLSASNAIAVEGFGLQFLESIQGSYTTIVGLPVFEVRVALTKLGFFL